MTAAQLELRRKLDYNISKFSEPELEKLYDYTKFLLFMMVPNLPKETDKTEGKPKMVLYNGQWLTENTVNILIAKKIHATDEEIAKGIAEYLDEKYK